MEGSVTTRDRRFARPARIGPVAASSSIAILLALGLSGCLPSSLPPTPSATPKPPTATATILFPTLAPTSTESLPTQPAPPAPLTGAEEVLFGAEFTQNEGWDLGPDALGATSLIDGALSIVVPRPNLTRLVRSPGASAHDLVLAASFQTEVCQAEDEYGLALLLSPAGDHLRFTVTCAGGLRVRRVVGGESRALEPFVPRDPMVNAGAPVHNRLVARVQGNDLLLYVNDVPVVHTTAPPLPAGGTGVVVQTDDVGDQATIVVEEFILYDLESNHTPAPDGTEIPDG